MPDSQDPKQQLFDALMSANAAPNTTLSQQANRIFEKKQKLDQATQAKIEALKNATAAWEKSQTLKGQALSLGTDNEYVRELTGGAVRGTGTALDGIGDLTGIEALQDAGNALKDTGNYAKESQNTTFARRMETSLPSGDLVDPESWQGPQDFHLEGLLGNLASMFGEMTPIIAASIAGGAPGVAASTVLGAGQSASAAGDEVYNRFASMDDETLEKVPYFATALIEANGDKAKARELTAQKAAGAAGKAAAIVGGLGGAATSKIFNLPKAFTQGGSVRRAVGVTGLSALEEGTQEVGESVAARLASNSATGDNQDLTAGSVTDFTLGALGGLGVAGAREAKGLATGDTQAEIEREKAAEVVSAIRDVESNGGDVFSVLDNESLDKTHTVQALATHLAAQKTPESKEKLKQLADEINKARDQFSMDEETKALYEQKLTELRERAKAQRDAGDTEAARETLLKYRDLKQKQQPGRIKIDNDKDFVSLSKAADTVNKLLDQTTADERKATAEKVQETVQRATDESAPVEERQKAAGEVVTLLMERPDTLDADTAEKLATDESNGLDSSSRDWLRNISLAQRKTQQVKDMGAVNSEILQGSSRGNFKSLNAYTADVRRALHNGNTHIAKAELKRLDAFRERQNQKAAAVQEALQLFERTGKPVQVVALTGKDGKWWTVRKGKKLSAARLAGNKGYTINGQSRNFADIVQAEAEAVQAHYDMLQKEAALRSGVRPAQVRKAFNEDRPVTPEQPQAQTEQQAAEQEEKPQAPKEKTPEASEKPKEVKQPEAETEAQQSVQEESAPEQDAVQEPVEETTDDLSKDLATLDQEAAKESGPTADVEKQTEENGLNNQQQARNEHGITNVAEETAESVQTVEQDTAEAESKAPQEPAGYATQEELGAGKVLSKYVSRKTSHVISRYQDFFKRLFGSEALSDIPAIAEKLDADEAVRGKQLRALDTLRRVSQHISKQINALYTPGTSKDLRYNLLKEYAPNGKLNSTVAAAISAGAFIHLMDLMRKPLYTTPADVIEGFGVREDRVHQYGPLGRQTMNTLAWGGVNESVFINDLGQKVADVLGIRLHQDMPRDLQEHLLAQLGSLAYAALQANGYVEVVEVPMADLQKIGLIHSKTEFGANVMYRMVRPRTQSNAETVMVNNKVQAIYESTQGSKGILENLFDLESSASWPTEEPPAIRDRIKGTLQRVPRALKKRLEKAAKQKHYIREDLLGDNGLLRKFSRKELEQMVGVDEITEDGVIDYMRPSVEGRNQGLQRELDNLFEFADNWDKAKPFYLPRAVWSVLRVGISSNVFNPQTSKIHRFVMKMDGWDYDVPLDESSEANQYFKAAVLLGLGVKVDKMTLKTALKHWDTEIEKFRPAIDVLKKIQTGQQVTPEERAQVVRAVRSEEGMHTLDALQHIAKYELARDAGQDSFTATMVTEADGTNNGPILSLAQAGLLNHGSFEGWGKKGGFFREQDGYKHAGEFAENPEERDLYEAAASQFLAFMKGKDVPSFWAGLAGKLENEDGSIGSAARNLFKQPSTALSFGSSIETVTASVGDSLFDTWFEQTNSLYQELLAASKSGTMTPAQIEARIKQHFADFEKATGYKIGVAANLAGLKQLKPTPEMFQQFMETYQDVYGAEVSMALKTVYEPFLEVRSSVVKISNAVAAAAQELFVQERAKLLKERMESGEIPTKQTKKGKVPAYDLSAKDYALLIKRAQKAMPILNTAQDKEASLSSGLAVAKMEKTAAAKGKAEEDGLYTGRYKTQPFKGVFVTHRKHRKGDRKGLSYKLKKMGVGDAGVRAFVTWIHSLDSAIASNVYQDHNVLNVHDAFLGNPVEAKEVARKYNETTFKLLVENSLPLETLKMGYRTLYALHNAGLSNTKRYKQLQEVLAKQEQVLYTAENRKLQFLKELKYVNQYGYEGGSYEVTEADVARIEELLKEHPQARVIRELAAHERESRAALRQVLLGELEKAKAEVLNEAKQESRKLHAAIVVAMRRMRDVLIRTDNVTRAFEQALNTVKDAELVADVRKRLQSLMLPAASTRNVHTRPESAQNYIDLLEHALREGVVPAADREYAQKLLEGLGNESTMEYGNSLKAIDHFTTLLDNDNAARRMLRLLDRYAQYAPVHEQNVNLGVPFAKPDPELVTLLESGEATMRDVKTYVYRALARNTKARARLKLYKRVLRAVPDDVLIQYITKDTPRAAYPSKAEGHFGYTTFDGSKTTIGVFSPDFKHSNVSAELLFHEMVHVATHEALNNPTARTRPLVRNLNTLYGEVKLRVSGDPALKAKFGPGIASLDEFVAWGLTNPEFQKFLTTFQVPVKSLYSTKGQLHKALDGLTTFFRNVLGLIVKKTLGKEEAQQLTGLQALTINAAGIIEQAKFVKAKEKPVTTLLMENNQRWTDMDAVQVLDALSQRESLDSTEKGRLRTLLNNIVVGIHGPLGALTDRLNSEIGRDPLTAFEQLVMNRDLPLMSHIGSLGAKLTKSQLFVAEQLDITIKSLLDSNILAKREVEKLYEDARKALSPEDLYEGNWLNATEAEKAEAQELYNRLFSYSFNAADGATRRDLVSRFVSLSLVYPPLRSSLAAMERLDRVQGRGIGSRIARLYERAMESLTRLLNRTPVSASADQRMYKMVQSLVMHKQLTTRRQQSALEKRAELFEAWAENLGGKAADSVVKLTKSSLGKKLRLSLLGTAIELARQDKIPDALDFYEKSVQRITRRRASLMTWFVNEVSLDRPENEYAHNLINSLTILEQQRQEQIETTKALIDEIVGVLPDEVEESLTQSIIKTDLSALLDKYPIQRIVRMLTDPDALNTEVVHTEQELQELSGNDPYYKNQAYALAWHMVTGEVRSDNLVFNARAIAERVGDIVPAPDPATVNNITPAIDRLTTLYALKHLDSRTVEHTRTWLQEKGPEALNHLMTFHKSQKARAKSTIFAGDSLHIRKGYTKDLYDPHMAVEMAYPAQAERLRQAGYQLIDTLPKDPGDPDSQPVMLFYHPTGGLSRYTTGGFSLTSKHARGTSVLGRQLLSLQEREDQLAAIRGAKQSGIEALHSHDYIQRFMGIPADKLAPVYDGNGRITDYRYLMNERTKQRLLNRNMRLRDVLAAVEGSIYDKSTSPTHNRQAVQDLYQRYTNAPVAEQDDFVEVGPDAESAELREAYARLPDDTRQAIKEIWGSNHMFVRRQDVHLLFGFRDAKLSAALTKPPFERDVLESAWAGLLKAMFRDKAVQRVDTFQRVWEEVTGWVKDMWVVKNLHTFLGNVSSNMTLLFWHGVSSRNLVNDHREGMEKALEYLRANRELGILRKQVAAGIGTDDQATLERIAELETILDSSPVKPLMDAGQFPTIMEDLDDVAEPFSFKSPLEKSIEKGRKYVPSLVNKAADQFFMTHDTTLYKILFKGTQLSDFIAKYVLYKHLTEHQANPMTEEEAQRRVRRAFINYNVPTHPLMNFLERMGFLMFTRYFLRIQRVILGMAQEKPLRGLLLALADRFFGGLQDVQDSFFLGRLGNPLQSGAFEAVDAFDDSIVAQTILAPF